MGRKQGFLGHRDSLEQLSARDQKAWRRCVGGGIDCPEPFNTVPDQGAPDRVRPGAEGDGPWAGVCGPELIAGRRLSIQLVPRLTW